MDSCRFDAVRAAQAPNISKLGELERRFSYASWTAPAHYNLLMGLMPHRGEAGRWSSAIYRENWQAYRQRLGMDLSAEGMLPGLWLPEWLSARGWHTGAWVSLPVLHPATPLSRGFAHYRLRERHADLDGILDDLRFYAEKPSFWMINTGETHYPYAWPGAPALPTPRLHGLHGALRHIGETEESPEFFSEDALQTLRERQVEAVRYLDGLLPKLAALAPQDAWLTVTADHGEAFGEGGFFGHGPVSHPIVYEVPFVEGPLSKLRP